MPQLKALAPSPHSLPSGLLISGPEAEGSHKPLLKFAHWLEWLSGLWEGNIVGCQFLTEEPTWSRHGGAMEARYRERASQSAPAFVLSQHPKLRQPNPPGFLCWLPYVSLLVKSLAVGHEPKLQPFFPLWMSSQCVGLKVPPI